MQINFDELRLKTLKDYNKLIKILNESVCEDVDMNRVIVPVDDITSVLDNLRMDMVVIMSLSDPSIPDCGTLKDIEVRVFSGDGD